MSIERTYIFLSKDSAKISIQLQCNIIIYGNVDGRGETNIVAFYFYRRTYSVTTNADDVNIVSVSRSGRESHDIVNRSSASRTHCRQDVKEGNRELAGDGRPCGSISPA